MNRFINRLMGGAGQVSKYSTDLFLAYKNKNYGELQVLLKTIKQIGPQEFRNCKKDGFTLLHYAVLEEDKKTFDHIMEEFGDQKEIINDNSNDVSDSY